MEALTGDTPDKASAGVGADGLADGFHPKVPLDLRSQAWAFLENLGKAGLVESASHPMMEDMKKYRENEQYGSGSSDVGGRFSKSF